MECEYPYYFILRKAGRIEDSNGRTVKARIEGEFGESRWHTCSYCEELSQQTRCHFIQVTARNKRIPLYLFFDPRNKVLLPATKETSRSLPWLNTTNLRAVESDWFLGGERILTYVRREEK
jgi:hypothetical protein